MNYKLVAIKMDDRQKSAVKVQNILTENGCLIKVRLGLHDIGSDVCSASGLILLEVHPENIQVDEMISALNSIEEVTAKDLTV
ncbi:hypothetical protein PM10SUCC1_25930 [Propionigenium maris DSM 9537]|uniref:Uncharacterized protein n=1 Tax=Propionigenium maris DSM 9537 TaxID=1123000 RepID=A0A9W6LNN5_9FUSO|nr:hypothetical protein [Propionigenium maris]GLI57079.1 hypothetical protein PM10SUCC1_25930 [Propionigenium maris DSM 9537]